MVDPRTPRTLDTRETRRRWKPASALPDPTPIPGWGYRWIMTHLQGEDQPQNISQKLREGYEPVNVKEHPELAAEANSKGEVRIGGLMLCKTPIELLEDRKAYFENLTNAQNMGTNSSYLTQADPRMPVFDNSKSGVSRGQFGNGNV